jgi:hypothetical protein
MMVRRSPGRDTGLFTDMSLIGERGSLSCRSVITPGSEDALRAVKLIRQASSGHYNTWS